MNGVEALFRENAQAQESVVDKIMQATLADLRYEEKDPTKLLPQDKSKPSGWLSKLGW